MLKKTLLTCWYIFVIVLLIMAFAISLIRAYPSLYQNHLPTIQSKISSIIGKPVQVNKLFVDWEGLTPHVTVKDLSIYSDDSFEDRLLFVRKAYLSINIYKSILERNLAFNNLSLIGSNLELHRTIDEKIILNGIDASERLNNRKESDKDSVRISLLESSIAIKDDIRKFNYFFDKVDFEIGIESGRIRISSKFSLPKTLGDELVLVADLKNIDKGFNDIRGDFYSKGKNINLQLISDIYPNLQVGINSGYSDFEIWGEFKSFSKKSFLGNIKLRELKYSNRGHQSTV